MHHWFIHFRPGTSKWIQAAGGFWCQLQQLHQVILATLASSGAPADAWEPKNVGMAGGDPGTQPVASEGFSNDRVDSRA